MSGQIDWAELFFSSTGRVARTPFLIAAAVLIAIAGLHAHWGLGGRWPAHDEATLADMVIGKTPGGRMPPPAACFGVAAALLAGVALILLVSFVDLTGRARVLVTIAYGVLTAVFLLRGAAGLEGHWERIAVPPCQDGQGVRSQARPRRRRDHPLCGPFHRWP
eukprot:gene31691-biopygen20376